MRLSPRHEPTTLAGLAVSGAVNAAVKQYDLTYPELIALLAAEMAKWTKFQIRDEREEQSKS